MLITPLPDGISARIEEQAARLREEIEHSPSVPAREKTYYIRADGDDCADGRTPATAWKTAREPERRGLSAGSLVLFRRGDLFRGGFRALPGVTYSSYGEGAKPRITASPFDGAKTGAKKLTTSDGVEMSKWAEDITLDRLEKVLASLEKAGVPTAYTDELDETLEEAYRYR